MRPRGLVRWAAAAGAAWLLAGCSASEPAGLTTLGLGLDAAECADHCVGSWSLELHHGAGGPFTGYGRYDLGCDELHIIEGLTPGHTFAAYVQAYAAGQGDLLFSGWSEEVTVRVDEDVETLVLLEAEDPPIVEALTPDPLVVGAGASLTITGQALRVDEGLGSVAVDGVELEAEAQADGSLEVTVPATASGGELVVSACAIAGAPFPLRLVHDEPAATLVQSGDCEDAEVVGLAPLPDGTGVAAALVCAAGGGELVRRTISNEACGETDPQVFEATPVALAAGEELWLTLADATLQRLSSPPLQVPLPAPPLDDGLAVDAGTAWVIVDDEEAPALQVGADGLVTPSEVMAASGPLGFVAAAAGSVVALSSGGTLLRLDGPDAVSAEVVATGCDDPRSLAVAQDATRAVVACASPAGLVHVPLGQAPALLPTAEALVGAALDAQGSVAFASTGSALVVLDLEDASELMSWPSAVGRLTSVASPERLAGARAGAVLELLLAWAPSAPCGP